MVDPKSVWAATYCASPPTASAGKYVTSNCSLPLLFKVAVYKCRDGTFNFYAVCTGSV